MDDLLTIISGFIDSGGAINSTANITAAIAIPIIPPTNTPDLSMSFLFLIFYVKGLLYSN